jgi:peptidoglycan/xylan/chitin deacetylase (PgdA/CDA1 family)
VVALTFDDGPNGSHTPPILDVLADRGVRATFFVFGQRAREHPRLIARALEEGHSVQPHCWADHASHHDLSRGALDEEIERTLEALAQLGCPAPRFWRPPYGDISDPDSYDVAGAHGLRLVTWTLETRDWEDGRTAERILGEIDGETREDAVLEPDSVVLMHDMPQAPQLLAGILDRIDARGYETGLLSEDSPVIAVAGEYRGGQRL